jgi:DNA-binding MarR family transcriptional regulator
MTSTEQTHPRHHVDEHLTAPIRLSIIAALSRADEIEFRVLRDRIEISDSALSKQISQLETAEYITVRKGYVGKRPRTWLSITPEGRVALTHHLAALNAIIGDAVNTQISTLTASENVN